jgi:NADPH-dependent 2,4-dienoyl-CoA reductase/sulfur reductase-like enzyme
VRRRCGRCAAGSFAAAELRRIGFDGRVTLLTSEDRLPYDKPNLSKDYLAGHAQEEWIPLRGETDYTSDRIELRLRTTVEEIDPARGEVRLSIVRILEGDGIAVPYASIVDNVSAEAVFVSGQPVAVRGTASRSMLASAVQ